MTSETLVSSDLGFGSPPGRDPKGGPITGVAGASAGVTPAAGGRREGAFGGRTLLGEMLVASGHHDEAAFARFYQLTSPWIYYLLRRWMGSTAHAEEALVRVYTTVWHRAAGFAPPAQSALAWVTVIAYEVAGS